MTLELLNQSTSKGFKSRTLYKYIIADTYSQNVVPITNSILLVAVLFFQNSDLYRDGACHIL
jgi:hypothetical protein